MGKENFDSFESPDEGVRLDSAYKLISELGAMQEKNVRFDKATLDELKEKIMELEDLQTAFGSAAPKEIGIALVKLRHIKSKHMESLETV